MGESQSKGSYGQAKNSQVEFLGVTRSRGTLLQGHKRVSSMTANSGIAGGLSMSKIGTIKVRELYLNGDPSKNLLSSYAQSKKDEPE